ncbi:mas-related G-protein coupled receptor member X1-like [Ctenodactylus gundi]
MDPAIAFLGTEHTPMNGSDQDFGSSGDKTLILLLLIIFIALVGLAGNMVVLWLLGLRMRRNAISVYILNLAVSDSLLLCCHFIGSLIEVISFFHGIPFPFGRTVGILTNITVIPYIAGLTILGAISTERCLCVHWPIWYRCHRPRHMSAVVCAFIWALSLLLSILDWHYSGFLNEFMVWQSWQKVNFIITAWLMFLFLTLLGSSLALLVSILCGSQRVPLTRLYATIFLTVLVFLICGLPFGIYWFLLSWISFHSFEIDVYLYLLTLVLTCVNSCTNPIIYFFIGSFRKRHQTLKLILQRALQDSPQEDECRDNTLRKEMSGGHVVANEELPL